LRFRYAMAAVQLRLAFGARPAGLEQLIASADGLSAALRALSAPSFAQVRI
jgi:hypothetical protein